MWQKLLTSKSTYFALGAVVGLSYKTVIPAIGRALRPVVKETVKGGIVLGQQVQTLVDEAREELEDIVAEAQQDLNH
jgi:F0F1-type ATP synthase membrane subunit b/b'